MTESFQVIIAGAGPGGCILARELAGAGIRVTVFEKGGYDALGHDWSDAVERSALKAVGFDAGIDENINTGPWIKAPGNENGIFETHAYPEMDVWSPDYSSCKQVAFRYVTTDRRRLGKLLVDQATAAGADVRFGVEVLEPILDGGENLEDVRVTGVRVRELETGRETDVLADVTIDDTGYPAVLRTQLPEATGIARAFAEDEFALVFRTVRERDREKAATDEVPDHYRYAYNTGYQWAQLLNDGEVDIGAGIRLKANVTPPKETVEAYISRHESITGREIRGGGGHCLVGISPFSLVSGGFMVIGDAGSQTIPLTGCGAGGAMIGGQLAAETIINAAKTGNTDIGTLWQYNYNWFVTSGRGANYAALTALRNILQNLDNADNSYLFRKDIFSGEMLTASINGVFQKPTLLLMVKTLVNCIGRPGILLKLNKATGIGTKLFKHYLGYPRTWDPNGFEKWRQKSEQLFAVTNR